MRHNCKIRIALLRCSLSAYGQFTVIAETIFPPMLKSFLISNKNTQIELEES